MEFQVLIEPGFEETGWCARYIEGIREEIVRMGGAMCLLGEGQLAALSSEEAAVIVVGSLCDWLRRMAALLKERSLCYVLAAPSPLPDGTACCVSMDYAAGVRHLMRYLKLAGRTKAALVGVYRNSLSDLRKQEAFVSESAPEHVYFSAGDVAGCCREFIDRIACYDSVICANDFVALRLMRALREANVAVPEQLYVTVIGESILSAMVTPGITTLALDCRAVGRSAVRLCALLRKNPSISSLNALLEGELTVRASTADFPDGAKNLPMPTSSASTHEALFGEDDGVRELLRIENLMSNLAEVDRRILAALARGLTYAEASTALFIGESTLKYRLRRMMTLCAANDRSDMLELVNRYLTVEDLTRLAENG